MLRPRVSIRFQSPRRVTDVAAHGCWRTTAMRLNEEYLMQLNERERQQHVGAGLAQPLPNLVVETYQVTGRRHRAAGTHQTTMPPSRTRCCKRVQIMLVLVPHD